VLVSAPRQIRQSVWVPLVASVVAGWSTAGCNIGQSCDFETGAMKLVAEVVDNGHTVRAEASFRSEDGAVVTPIELCEDDILTINGQEPIETIKLDRVTYSLTQDFEDAPRDFLFELVRDARDEVVEARVTLPGAFEILSPANGESLSRADEVDLTWEPPEPEGEMQIEIEEMLGGGICIETRTEGHDYKRHGGIRVEDGGTWKIPAGTLTSELDEPCDAVYKLTRAATGEYPEALDRGGFVEGRVQRMVGFESTP
jgi:hypothetical protein